MGTIDPGIDLSVLMTEQRNQPHTISTSSQRPNWCGLSMSKTNLFREQLRQSWRPSPRRWMR